MEQTNKSMLHLLALYFSPLAMAFSARLACNRGMGHSRPVASSSTRLASAMSSVSLHMVSAVYREAPNRPTDMNFQLVYHSNPVEIDLMHHCPHNVQLKAVFQWAVSGSIRWL